MRWIKAAWFHDSDVEPIEIFSEVGADGYEVRAVERYRDGRLEWADSSGGVGMAGLGELPIPAVEEINEMDEFSASEIDRAEFEQVWERARTSG